MNEAKKGDAAQREKRKLEWHIQRNKRRRERYRNDPEYRRKVLVSSSPPVANKERSRRCAAAAHSIHEHSKERASAAHGVIRVLTSREMSDAIGLAHVAVLHRWQRGGKFPRPVTLCRVGRTWARVYRESEAAELLRVLSKMYLRGSVLADPNVIAKLHQCVSMT